MTVIGCCDGEVVVVSGTDPVGAGYFHGQPSGRTGESKAQGRVVRDGAMDLNLVAVSVAVCI